MFDITELGRSNDFGSERMRTPAANNNEGVVNFMKKAFEEFERHITLKMNEEKIRINGELNVTFHSLTTL